MNPAKTKALLYFFSVFLFFLSFSSGRLQSHDTEVRLAIAHALWTEGTVFLPATHPVHEGLVFPPSSSGGTSFYGIGQTLVLIPFDVLGTLLAKFFAPPETKLYAFFQRLPLFFLYLPLIGTLLCFFLSKVLEKFQIKPSPARILAFLCSICSISFVYNTQSLQEESLIGLLLVLSFYFLLRWKETLDASPLAWAAFLAGYCLCIRLNSLFALLLLFGFGYDTLIEKKAPKIKSGAIILLGLLPVFLLYLFFSWWRFGSVFATGYNLNSGVAFGPSSIATTFYLLFGLGKGLFILSPVLCVAFYWILKNWRTLPFFCLFSIVGLLGSALFHSRLYGGAYPDGSESWGTRFQVHLAILLLIPASLGILELWKAAQWKRLTVVTALGIGFVFQVLACMAPDSEEYCRFYADSLPRDVFVASPAMGQLGLRLKTVQGNSPNRTICSQESHLKARYFYMPNIWGFSYSKHIPNPKLGTFITSLWCAVFLLSCFLLVWQFRKTPLALEPL